MLPAATSCSSGFHRWLRARSTRVTEASPRRPSVSPSLVASSRPAAPPPTMTIRCRPASGGARSVVLLASDSCPVASTAATSSFDRSSWVACCAIVRLPSLPPGLAAVLHKPPEVDAAALLRRARRRTQARAASGRRPRLFGDVPGHQHVLGRSEEHTSELQSRQY